MIKVRNLKMNVNFSFLMWLDLLAFRIFYGLLLWHTWIVFMKWNRDVFLEQFLCGLFISFPAWKMVSSAAINLQLWWPFRVIYWCLNKNGILRVLVVHFHATFQATFCYLVIYGHFIIHLMVLILGSKSSK